MTYKVMSKWTGSPNTSTLVRNQIIERWGEEEAKRYDPRKNCLTFSAWKENGCTVKKGEKGIKSFIVVEKKNKETGEVVARHLKTIYLFYEKQVEADNA